MNLIHLQFLVGHQLCPIIFITRYVFSIRAFDQGPFKGKELTFCKIVVNHLIYTLIMVKLKGVCTRYGLAASDKLVWNN